MSEPLVWAHRGASGYCPENTLPAFEMAEKMGADGVELDVQLTRDGELVVCHDETIDRTSNGSGYLKSYTLKELKRLDFSHGNFAYEGVRIPTMREVFECLKDGGLTINIELKTGIFFYPGIEEKIVSLTHELGFEKRVIYSSFNHYSIMKLKALDPEARTGFLYCDGTMDMPSYAAKHGVDALHPALYNLQFPHYMEECRRAGLEVNVWTVNSREHILLCREMGVHAIIGNYPDKIRSLLNDGKGSDRKSSEE